jgi:flagellar hook assembly protein FlgD
VVNTLLQEDVEVGPLEIPWDGRDHAGATIASGVYLVEAQVAGERALEKIVLLK